MKYYEEFFIAKIAKGLKLDNNNFIGYKDKEILLTSVSEVEKLDRLFNEIDLSKEQWNEKMVLAIKRSLDNEIIKYPEYKKFAREIGESYEAPNIIYNEMYKPLYENSDTILSGVVQNWYLKHFNAQSKSLLKQSGCLTVFFLISSIFIVLILILLKTF